MREKQSMAPPPEPPEHLSERSKALWRALVPDRARSLGRRVMLQAAPRPWIVQVKRGRLWRLRV